MRVFPPLKSLIAFVFGIVALATAENSQAQYNPFNPDFAFCNTQGAVATRKATKWDCLLPGTAGQVLRSGGAGADVSWLTVTGSGTVTSVAASGGTTGMTWTGSPITAAGTLTLGGTLIPANGGTGFASYTIGDLIYASASTTLAKLAIAGSTDQILGSTGSAPAWQNISSKLTAGTGIGITGTTNATITNSGVTSAVAGTGIGVSGATGAVTFSNSGVLTVSGGTTGLTPSSATAGAVTLAGTLNVANGGTGQTTFTDGQLLIGNTTGNTLTKATLTAGTGITITNGTGSITITAATEPAGIVQWYAGASPPTGYLACNGAAVSRTTYASLFSAISTTYGAGDGSTTFNLPDVRGYFIRGLDAGRGVDTGRALGSNQMDAFQSHTHELTGYAPTGSFTQTGASIALSNTGNMNVSAPNTGRTATETRPINIAMNCIIRH